MQALAGESDRGIVLVAAEFISDALEELLRSQFSKNGVSKKLQDKLLTSGPTAPAYSFAMRTNFCWAFGLIGRKTFNALNSLREIRNKCAHMTRFSLQDTQITDHVRVLDNYFVDRMGDKSSTSIPKNRHGLSQVWSEAGEDVSKCSPHRMAILNGSYVLWFMIWFHQDTLKRGFETGTV